MSNAMTGMGILVRMADPAAPTVWTTLAEVFNVSPPADTDDQIDVTHYQSAGNRREFITGFTDGGEIPIEMNFVPGSATDVYMVASKGVTRIIEITYPNGVTVTFNGLRTGYEISPPIDDKMTATATFKVTGAITQTAAAAPVNSTLPAIAGLPKVGVVLTAFEGEWSGAPAFTYQWKKGGANISGATTRNYTPVVGDIGGALTVAVTGTNTTGSATATSTAAINVVA